MHFLDCPECGAPLREDPEKSLLTYICSECGRSYLYEEGSLVDLGPAEPPRSREG